MVNAWVTVLFLLAIVQLYVPADGQGSCPSLSIAPSQRRDCYPWPDLNQARCEERGCVYCPDSTPGVPWCFINDEVCPSVIPEASRVNCETGGTKNSCLARGCLWCPTTGSSIPWCFVDDTISLGGEICPNEIPESERVDCFPTNFPDGQSPEELCVARGCYWCSSQVENTPWCFIPRSHGYRIVGDGMPTEKGYRIQLERINTPSWYGEDISRINVDLEFQESARLRVKIYDALNARYEVPPLIASPPSMAPNPLYEVVSGQVPSFYFKILRKSTGTVLFDSSIGGLIFSDQFLQIAAKLPTSNVYGFGETKHSSFRHDMNWKSWSMFSRDEPVNTINLYGVHPFFTALDTNGDMFGALFLNSNAQEIELMPAPGLLYRTIGGVLDMYFFLGPDPESVVRQYLSAIGRPVMPPYWALGFHLAKYGYNDLETMQAAVNRLRQYDIPHDVQYGDIDYFDRNMDFTLDTINYAGLPDYVRQLKTEGTRFITILDPFIESGETPGTYPPFDRGQQLDIWVKKADGVTNAESKCWPPTNSFYPDFSKPSCQQWWTEQCVNFHDTIEFDGIWVDMNEPASFVPGSPTGCDNNKWNYPIYKPRTLGFPGNELFFKTLCTDYLTSAGRRYDVHSLYGRTSTEATVQAVRQSTGGKRSIIISRSSFPGAGSISGRWLGDNNASWESMQESIIGTLEFNLFGIPFIGADICGYFGDSYPELCTRWMQVGAFYPFSRNHNGQGWQDHDPGYWPEVAVASRDILMIRYTVLPYLYTLFHVAHTAGDTVVRPLLHEFTNDPATYGIDRQFLWGPAFMVTPVLTQGATTVTGYFPDAPWYRYRDGGLEPFRKQEGVLSAPLDFIPLHVRGGHILPTQTPANSTMFSRSLPMGLIVALDDSGEAGGSLFWDEGDTPDTYENGEYFLARFTASGRILSSSITVNNYPEIGSLIFNTINIWGLAAPPTQVLVNGQLWASFTYNSTTRVLILTQLTLTVNASFTVEW